VEGDPVDMGGASFKRAGAAEVSLRGNSKKHRRLAPRVGREASHPVIMG
jgi:hypothetical protein